MPSRIIWSDKARAQLRAIDQTTAMRILHALGNFAATGEGDVIRLQGIQPPELRLRVGDYRLRFNQIGGEISVESVKHRRDVYR